MNRGNPIPKLAGVALLPHIPSVCSPELSRTETNETRIIENLRSALAMRLAP